MLYVDMFPGGYFIGQWVDDGTGRGTTSTIVGLKVGVIIADENGNNISTGAKASIYLDDLHGRGAPGQSWAIYSLDLDPSFFNGAILSFSSVTATYFNATSSITSYGPFGVHLPGPDAGYSFSFDPNESAVRFDQESAGTRSGALIYDQVGSETGYVGYAGANTFNIAVTTAGESPGSGLDSTIRIQINDANAADASIAFNPSNRGFVLGESSMTFDSGSSDPVMSWLNNGQLNFTLSTMAITGRLIIGSSVVATGLVVSTISANLSNNNNILVNSTVTVTANLIGTKTTDLGWTIQSTANQACNTTCTYSCVHGWETSVTEVAVNCLDATADKCLCAGPN